MQTLTVFLADYLIVVIYGLVLHLWTNRSTRQLAIASLASSFIAWIISIIIKNLFYFPRPYIVSSTPPLVGFLLDGTFPSSHTALSFALAFSVFTKKRPLGLLLLSLSILVASARVFGGVHTLTDVLAGAALGTISTLLVQYYFRSRS